MKKILLIEDDQNVRYALNRYLTKQGYEVFQLENGHHVIQTIAKEQPDIIVTDVIMPETDGLEVIMQVKKQLPNLPIIAMSGGIRGIDVSILEHAELFGAAKILVKPFDEEELVNYIEELT